MVDLVEIFKKDELITPELLGDHVLNTVINQEAGGPRWLGRLGGQIPTDLMNVILPTKRPFNLDSGLCMGVSEGFGPYKD